MSKGHSTVFRCLCDEIIGGCDDISLERYMMKMSIISKRVIIISSLLLLLFISLSSSSTLSSSTSEEIGISVVSLLLPYTQSKAQVYYKLEAKNGCFDWTTNNPELLSLDIQYESQSAASCDQPNQQPIQPIQPINDLTTLLLLEENQEKCSKSVLVGVKSGFSERLSTLIIAEEKSTGVKLRCEVFVDRISQIGIKSTTRTMYKDSVEVLEVQALDSQGNIFSTILGVEFEWTVSSGTILQIVPFKDHKMTNNPVLLSMEQRGLQSSQVLVQGIDTGRAEITVKLTEQNYKPVKPTSVVISVLEPLSLNPSQLLYVIPGTQIQYILQSEKRNQIEKINMPNSQYLWSTNNNKVGVVDNSGLFMAINFGKTDLTVQHVDMSENRAHTSIHVVNPSYLAIKVEALNLPNGQTAPVTNWNLIQGKNYTLIVELYDASGHKIYNSDISYNVEISKDYFQPISSSSVQSKTPSDHYHIKPILDGSTIIKASLLKIYDPKVGKFINLINPIMVEQELIISKQIKIEPNTVYLPFVNKNTQQYQFKAIGGLGEYNWYTNNRSLIDIDQQGIIQTTFKKGSGKVIVVDKKNPHNRDEGQVHIVDPSLIEFVPSKVEVEIGQPLVLSTIVKTLTHGFDNCSVVDLSWKLQDSKIFSINPVTQDQQKLTANYCSSKQITPIREGNTLVTVELGETMKAQQRIFAYPPLRLDKDEALVTLGSSVDIQHQGGPEQWYLEPKSFFQQVDAENPASVKIQIINPSSFRVTCLAHGEQYITLCVGNKPTTTNPFPAQPCVKLFYNCQLPKSLKLIMNQENININNNNNNNNDCKDLITSSTSSSSTSENILKIRNNRQLELSIQVYDQNGKEFTNHSTLSYDWSTTSGKNLDQLQLVEFNQPNSKKSMNQLILFDRIGKTMIFGKMVGYNIDMLNHERITTYNPIQPLVGQLELELLSNILLDPQSTTIYLSNKNQIPLQVIGGSRHFTLSSNNTKIATLEKKLDQIRLLPIYPGYLKVTINDNCLESTSSSVVLISDVNAINVRVEELISIGKSIDLELEALASDGQEFSKDQYQFINFIPHIDNPSVLEVVPNPSLADPKKYIVKGIDSGVATLTFSSHNPQTGQTVTSRAIQITVYPPFTISPHTLHLVPGSHFQIQPQGGVARQVITFASTNPSVASIGRDISGELIAHGIGEATITASSHYVDRDAKKIFIGQDQLTVTVKNMTGINLHSTINRLVVGNELKLRVVGDNGETPFTYGTVDLAFGWECLDHSIVQLAPIYSNTTVEMEASFSVRVIGRQAGSTQVIVYAYHPTSGDRSKRIFQSPPFQIDVISAPAFPTHSILLMPNSHYETTTKTKNLQYNNLVLLDNNQQTNQVCANQLIVQSQNKLLTNDRVGHCYLEVVRDGRIDTTSLIKVSTKLVAHLELVPIHSTSMVLPIGATATFGLYLRDDLGDTFTDYGAIHKAIKAELSNVGIISVNIEPNDDDEHSGTVKNPPLLVQIQGLNVGLVTLRISYKSIDDYIKIFVGRLIEPDVPVLHVGASLQLSLATNLLSMRGYSVPQPGDRIWTSSNANVLQIDSATGRATANPQKAGQAIISYTRNPSSQVSVLVSRVETIKLENPNQVVINGNSEQYVYPLRFFASNGQEFTQPKDSSAIEQNYNCQCSVQQSMYASATCIRGTTPSTYHNYSCIIRTVSGEQPASTNLDHLSLQITVSNNEKTYVAEQIYNIPFENSFRIIYKSNTNLSPSNPSLHLKIQVNSHSSNQLFINEQGGGEKKLLSITQVASSTPNVHEYIITPLDQKVSFSQPIPIHIGNSNQKVKGSTILVNFNVNEPKNNNNNNNNSTESSSFIPYTTLGRVLVAIGIALLTFLGTIYYNQKPRTTIEVKTPLRHNNNNNNNNNNAPPPSPFRSPIPNNLGSSSLHQSSYQPPQQFNSPIRSDSSLNNSIYNFDRSRFNR
ncbi:nucleoporin [Cavenderia fasciculata]|uniref:Nucleoporin n=1 Tax=Cavenderia fasciculata TaxID=261658 RepID=F4PPQ1_CACFS|nr:nucleoporin [Cavenderia fasciculata]EGG22364.1 nucleoporin [Cavenderia fasciculata]|eukprot:XP_004360215.1 nucleoporin [Cavenderia fasciculata]